MMQADAKPPVIVAEFGSTETLRQASRALREAGLGETEAYLSYEDETLIDEFPGRPSIVPLLVLIAGLAGFAAGFWMQDYAASVSYPLNIGGRPLHSWPAYVPIAFEIGVLAAVSAGFFGFLIVNRLPAFYSPLDGIDRFHRASRDSAFLSVATEDPEAHGKARALLARFEPDAIDDVPP